jgi:formylglycine-generating enzyme required for sulfatase activity
MEIGLVEKKELNLAEYHDKKKIKRNKYKRKIKSLIDKREMVYIPEGNFFFGSNKNSKDERPQLKINLPAYYIDKYEVTNKAYLKFIHATKSPYPKAWSGKIIAAKYYNLPILVTYVEAAAYAKWCKKRLPTEEEWEKAANGIGYTTKIITPDGFIQVLKKTNYPWGDSFNSVKCNSQEFWSNKSSGKSLKSRYKYGLLPVGSFSGAGNSAYGVADMSGNAAEWTSSWFKVRYNKNIIRSGKQVKVIKGGAWYSSYQRVRVSARDYGGIPSLSEDNIAGFRCVKSVSEVTR